MSEVLKIYKNGDIIEHQICFTYNGTEVKTNQEVTITGLDNPGISIESLQPEKGIIVDGVWKLAQLVPGKQYCLDIYAKIVDSCEVSKGIKFTLSDSCGCGPDSCSTLTAFTCCTLQECISIEEIQEELLAGEIDCALIGTH